MEGEFVRTVPEKWEPGERAAMVKHRDNLLPPGPVEDNRDKAPASLKGDRAPVVRHGDNLRAEGEFEKRSVEEFRAAERAVQVKQADHLKLEGEMRYIYKYFYFCL